MKIAELKQGKKYYHTFATNNKISRGGPKIRNTSIIRVIQVDLAERRVLASFNCFPAQWYPENVCKNWTEKNISVIANENPLS